MQLKLIIFSTMTLFLSLTAFADCDFNDDCIVNFSDFAVIASDWLSESPSISDPNADINSDDIVDVNDLILFAEEWLDMSSCNPVDVDSEETITTHVVSEMNLIATDKNGDTLSYIVTSLPTKGYLRDPACYPCASITSVPYTLTGNGNKICYETVSSTNGSFNWKANDGSADSDGATVTLTVSAHPKDHLSFGKDGIITIDDEDELDMAGNFGFALFVKTYAIDCTMVSKYEIGVGGWEYKLSDGKPQLLLYGTTGLTDTVNGTSAINDGQWHNVGFCYDPNATQNRVYVDFWQDITTQTYSNSVDIKIGLGYWWDIDNIRAYSLTTYFNPYYSYTGIFEQPRDTAGDEKSFFGITIHPAAKVRFKCDYDGTNNTTSQIYDDLTNHYTGSINSKRYIRYYPYFMDPCKN